MTDIAPANREFHRATLFLRSLIAEGVRHTIVSPGSRSTPLALAVSALPQLKSHIILDERSAAFTALGIGKATALPAALVCTSGTAVANYFPAVIEARKSGVPLLLFTADRPAELHHTGSNQTIDQHHIFGHYAVFYHSIGDLNKRWYLKRIANQAVQQAVEQQGPAHLNFPFRKPLEPDLKYYQNIQQENAALEISTHQKSIHNHFYLDDAVLQTIKVSKRPLIIVGQLAPGTNISSITSLAEQLHAPVLSEQGLLNFDYNIQGFDGFLRLTENLEEHSPDLILRFGHEPASKSLLLAIQHWNPQIHLHFADVQGEKSDINHTTTHFIKWDGNPFEIGSIAFKSDTWLLKWKETQKIYFNYLQLIMDEEDKLTDLHVYHELAPVIPDQWAVCISNSLPARDRSMVGRWGNQAIFTNRGVSGIDGNISTAMGISMGSDKTLILFTGDLAFLHDSNALLNDRQLCQPVIVIIINNQGGSIFRMLPIAKNKKVFKTYFETPQHVDIQKLAKSYDINYTPISTVESLRKINLLSLVEKSGSMMHIVECKTNADRSMAIRTKLWNHFL